MIDDRLAKAVPRPTPPNPLVRSILVSLLCFLPLGVVAFVWAAQVDGAARRRDHGEAWRLSRVTGPWCKAAFPFAAISILILVSVLAMGLEVLSMGALR